MCSVGARAAVTLGELADDTCPASAPDHEHDAPPPMIDKHGDYNYNDGDDGLDGPHPLLPAC